MLGYDNDFSTLFFPNPSEIWAKSPTLWTVSSAADLFLIFPRNRRGEEEGEWRRDLDAELRKT